MRYEFIVALETEGQFTDMMHHEVAGRILDAVEHWRMEVGLTDADDEAYVKSVDAYPKRT